MCFNIRRLTAAMAAVLALSLCACSLTENDTSSEAPAQTEAVSAAAPVSDDSTEQTDPMLEPKKVAVTYMKAQGKGFDEELTKIMSDYYAARYEYLMSTDPGEQFEYNEDDFKFEFDHDNCGFIAKVNVEESYDKACGLAVTATYGEGVEPVSKYIVLIQDSSDKQWKICYVGTKADAYLSKTIEDEYSQKIMDNAKAVYDAAQNAFDELSKSEDYEFEFINYLSSEDDEFIKRIKDQLPDDVKDTYFAVFLDDGKLDHILWGETVDSQIIIEYPTEDVTEE